MPYSWYYDYFQGLSVPTGSRNRAYIFPGAVCPQQTQFGRVHGTAPARGSVTFKGLILVPAGQIFYIQIGQSAFLGRSIKGEINNNVSTGNSTTLQLVDMRDRLHDFNHFAQYNMMDEDGTWWHILAEDWEDQKATYIQDLQDIEDFYRMQEIQNIPVGSENLPLFSAMTLLNYFAETYFFSFSYTGSAEDKLRTSYPENLDWNGGRRVIDCLDEMLSKLNLQFTVWGSLHIHVSERGVADTYWEQQMLAGNINFCLLRGHKESALGGELTDAGRRVKIVGGRNSYEVFHPCFPDWNPKWTLGFVNDVGMQISALLAKENLFLINRMDELPYEWQDHEKFNSKRRSEMTIRDYLENIPFKCYFIDFNTNLILITYENLETLARKVMKSQGVSEVPAGFNVGEYVEYKLLPSGLVSYELFNWDTWYSSKPDYWIQSRGGVTTDSKFPISSNLPSDSTRQFLVRATSRKFSTQGLRDEEFFARGVHTWITDGTGLDIDDWIFGGNRYWRVSVTFSEMRIAGSAVRQQLATGEWQTIFQWTPDKVAVLIAQDKEQFTRIYGESAYAPRVRETIRSIPRLKRSFVYFDEVPMLKANLATASFSNQLYASDLADEIARRALNHQMITVAGHITFRTNAGFQPSGIIDNVSISFDSRNGTQESVNFTNIRSDERVPVFHTPLRRRFIRGEEELEKDKLREEGKRILRFYNQQRQGIPVANARENQFNTLAKAHSFGGQYNAADVEVLLSELTNDQLLHGELMVVNQAGDATIPSDT